MLSFKLISTPLNRATIEELEFTFSGLIVALVCANPISETSVETLAHFLTFQQDYGPLPQDLDREYTAYRTEFDQNPGHAVISYFQESLYPDTVIHVKPKDLEHCIKFFRAHHIPTQAFSKKVLETCLHCAKQSESLTELKQLCQLIERLNLIDPQGYQETMLQLGKYQQRLSKKLHTQKATQATDSLLHQKEADKAALIEEILTFFTSFGSSATQQEQFNSVWLTCIAFSNEPIPIPELSQKSLNEKIKDLLNRIPTHILQILYQHTCDIPQNSPDAYSGKVRNRFSFALYKTDHQGSFRYPVLTHPSGCPFLIPAFQVAGRDHQEKTHITTMESLLNDKTWTYIEEQHLTELDQTEEGEAISKAAGSAASKTDERRPAQTVKRKAGASTTPARSASKIPDLENLPEHKSTANTFTFTTTVNTPGITGVIDLAIAKNEKYEGKSPRALLDQENQIPITLLSALSQAGIKHTLKQVSRNNLTFECHLYRSDLPSNLGLSTLTSIQIELTTLQSKLTSRTLLNLTLLAFFKSETYTTLRLEIEERIERLKIQKEEEQHRAINTSKSDVLLYLNKGGVDPHSPLWKQDVRFVETIQTHIQRYLTRPLKKEDLPTFERHLAFYLNHKDTLKGISLPSVKTLLTQWDTFLKRLTTTPMTDPIQESATIRLFLEAHTLSKNDLQSLSNTLYKGLLHALKNNADYAAIEAWITYSTFIHSKFTLPVPDQTLSEDIQEAGTRRLQAIHLFNRVPAAPPQIERYLTQTFRCEVGWSRLQQAGILIFVVALITLPMLALLYLYTQPTPHPDETAPQLPPPQPRHPTELPISSLSELPSALHHPNIIRDLSATLGKHTQLEAKLSRKDTQYFLQKGSTMRFTKEATYTNPPLGIFKGKQIKTLRIDDKNVRSDLLTHNTRGIGLVTDKTFRAHVTFYDGSTYEGELLAPWIGFIPHGKGTFTPKSGAPQNGFFDDGKFTGTKKPSRLPTYVQRNENGGIDLDIAFNGENINLNT